MNLYCTYESRDTFKSFGLFLTVKIISKLDMENSVKFKIEILKLAVVVRIFQTTQNLASFHVVVLQRTAEKCTKIYNARALPLFCSLNLWFSYVPVAVVVFLNSLTSLNGGAICCGAYTIH